MSFDIHFDQHLIWLWLALGLFMIGSFKKNSTYSLVGIALLITSFYLTYKKLDTSFFLHIGLDMMLVASLGYFAMAKGKVVRIIYFMMASILLIFTHSFLSNLQSKVVSNTLHISVSEADPNGELLVKFKNQKSLNKWIDQNQSIYNITYPAFTPEDKSYSLDEYLILDLDNDKNIDEAIISIESESLIEYVEVNEVIELKLPKIGSQNSKSSKASNINDPEINKQWISKNYDIDKYHDKLSQKILSYNKKESVIAILDTGIDAEHEDLKDNYTSTMKSYDSDIRGHGTHCAGIAAAVTGNGIGIASWIPQGAPVKITSIKVLNNMGMGTQRTIVNGILKAADTGADVISLSLGAKSNPSREKAYKEAVAYALDKGSIVVVAAGNSKSDAQYYSPANTPGVITVAAVDSTFQLADFSNYVDNLKQGISAPGAGIYSTLPGNKYGAQNGTSMAAPFVSGVIGLMRLYSPDISAEEAYTILKRTSIENGQQSIVNPVEAIDLILD